MLSEVCSRGTAYQYPVLPWASLAPAHFLEVHDAAPPIPQSEWNARSQLLDDWLIFAQSRDTPASHIGKLLQSHLEFLRLCVNMHKSILAPSQSNVSGSVLSTKAVEIRARPPFYLPCAFSKLGSLQRTHAPAAVLAEISSALDGMDLGPFAHRGLHELATSKLWDRATKASSAGGVPPGLGDVTCRGHDWTHQLEAGGAVCEGMLTLGLWSEPQSRWHINRLELEAVFLALRIFSRSWNSGMYWFAPKTCLWFRT